MLQQVFVLQQQLVDSSLRLQSGRGLRVQLVPQKVDLQEMMRSEDRHVRHVETTDSVNVSVASCSQHLVGPQHRLGYQVKD